MVCSASLACAIIIASITYFVASESVYEVLGKRKHLSEFYSKVGLETVLVTLLDSRVVTVFAPTNEAFRKFRARKSDEFKSDDTALAPRIYVMNSLAEKHDFPLRKAPYKADVAPLYMTVKNETYQPIEYFVNNAKIIGQEECRGTRGEKQILYIIDDILEQYIPHMAVAPHALDLLKSPGIYKEIKEPLDAFASRVTSEREKEIFNRVGQHTFFIPVGSAEEASSAKLQEIDTWVVRGHVISGQVLFLRTMSRKSYRSQTWGDNLRVNLKITNESPNEDYDQWYIESNTIVGDARHRKGVVRAKIVRPNIPVSNGVIHLISKPLMIIDKTIWEHIEELKDTKLGEFYSLASKDANFMSHLKSSDQTTVFAPTDKAFKSLQNLDKFQEILSDNMATRHMLELHMVMRPIVTEDVWNKSVISMSASDNRRNLYLRAIGDERNKTLTVEGEGVNATAVMGDVGATNGILHVIDGVLGMPYLTIYSKLAQDPDLHTTYKLGMQDSWNQKLSDKEKRYTFFAPSREAWEELQKEMPSEHKQLNLGIFSYHVQKILDRHLVVGHVFTKEDLESQKSVQMVHGNFQISSGYETGSLKVKWEGLEAHIVRPDVKATNGIIHVIDRVMMKRRDLTKSGAESSCPPIITLALAAIMVLVQIAL